MAKVIAACLVLGALSLALPSEPSYDPWAWLVWGRELVHLELDTSGGPTWKPLAAGVAAALAPLEGLGSDLPGAAWIALTRAGSLFALVLAFRLARRLSGAAGIAGIAAGTFAAASLFLLPDWFQFTAQGNEAPVAVALVLWAIERHLDDSRRGALLLGGLASLLRPELFPFVIAYGVLGWRAWPELRRPLACLAVAIPALWVVPEWIGAGNPLDGGAQAASRPYWGLSHADHPWLRALSRVHNHAGVLVELFALVATAAALASLSRARPGFRGRAVLVIAAAAGVQIATFAAMTQIAFSGSPRYVLPALALLCVLAGVGVAAVASPAPGIRAAGAVAALALLAAPPVVARVDRLRGEAREVGARMELHQELVSALALAGGAEVVSGCGVPGVNRALQTRMAWELHRPIDHFEDPRTGCFAFETRLRRLAGKRAPRRRGLAVQVARAGSWRVYRVYMRFAALSHPCEEGEESGAQAQKGTRLHRSLSGNSSASLPFFPIPDVRSNHDHDHRSRIPGSRQREHDPADHRGWARCRGRYSQAVLEPHPEVPPDQEGRAGDRQGGHRTQHRRRLATFPPRVYFARVDRG
jgi:hypothetical protein